MGFGKSLCYVALTNAYGRSGSHEIWFYRSEQNDRLLSWYQPLLALMKDQVATYSAKGLSVGSITLEITPEERSRMREGKYNAVAVHA